MNKKMKFWMAAGLITVLTGTSTAALAAGKAPLTKLATTTQDGQTTQNGQATQPAGGKFAKGEFRGGFGGGKMMFGEDLFTLLNLTQEEFQTQTAAGKTLVEIGAAQNVTEQQLIDFFTKQNATQLDAAVTAGKLTTEQATEMKTNFSTKVKDLINNPVPVGKGGFGKGGHGGHGKGLMMFNDELFTLLNITQEQFQTEQQAGKTLVEIGATHNVTEQQLIDFFTKQNTAHLDQEVTDGKHTQEQADQMKADFPTRIKEMINNTLPAPGEGKGKGKGKGFGKLGGPLFNDELFTLLNISQEQFQTEAQSGKTLLEIAQAHNVTEQQLTDFLVKQRTDALAQKVTDGKLTQEQADELKAGIADQVKTMITQKPGEHPAGGPGFGGKGFGGKGMRFGQPSTEAPATDAPTTQAPATQAAPQSYKL